MMKNNVNRTILSIFVLLFILCLFPMSAYAASASAAASKSTIAPGETVTITVTFKGKNIGAVEGSYSVSSNILQEQGGSGIQNGIIAVVGDGSSARGTISFKATKEGSATISFTGEKIISFEEENLGSAKASTTITVKKPAASKPAPKPSGGSSSSSSTKPPEKKEPEKEPEPEVNPVDEALKISLDGKDLYMWRDLSTVKLPDGFKSADATYQTEKVKAAKGEESDITLVYLTDKEGKNGTFYVLDKSENLYPYINLNSSSKYTILLLDSTAKLPEGYVETELEVDGRKVQAWVHEADEDPEFYLLYVMNAEGEKDFYLYDQGEKTMQRYTNRTVIVEVEKEPEPMTFFQKLSSDPSLLATVSTLGALSIILLVALGILYKKTGKQGRH